MSDNENNPYNLNITFKYEYFDKKLQKEVKYDYTILNNGVFLHSDIRNQNFYDNIIDKYAQLKKCPHRGQQSCDNIKPAIVEADKKPMNLAIPFSNKYIDLDILDKIIINEGKDKSKNEKLGFNDLLKELKENTDGSYNITKYDDFIEDILSLFTENNNNKGKVKKNIEKFLSNKQNIPYNKFIKEIIDNDAAKEPEATEPVATEPVATEPVAGEKTKIYYTDIALLLEYLKIHVKPQDNLQRQPSKFYTEFMRKKKEKEKEEQKEKNIFEKFKNKNFMKLFDKNSGEQITELFNILDEDYDKVSTFNKEIYSSSYLSKGETHEYNSKKPKYYNTEEKLESIIYDYAQYIDKDIYNKLKKNKKDLINHITQRVKPFKQIITYYNIFKLLTELYIIKDTIIFNTNLKGSHYKKILKIEPMQQPKLYPIFQSNNINFIYFVTFEDIPDTSIIRFNINIINNDEKMIKNDKKSWQDIMDESNDDVEKYIPYNTSIYSQKNNLSEYIIYNHKLDVKKIISQFQFLIQNNNL